MNFYSRSLSSALQSGQLLRADRILVVGGGEHDRRTLADLGFQNALITNLAPHAGQDEYAPYPWQREDAEALNLPDDHFDWAIEHAALHHLGSPHRGLLELLRVARKGVIAFEVRDSALMRLAVSLSLTHVFTPVLGLLLGMQSNRFGFTVRKKHPPPILGAARCQQCPGAGHRLPGFSI